MNEKVISVLGALKRIVLCHSSRGGEKTFTIMESLSKKDEDNIEELIAHKRHIYFKNSVGGIVDETDILTYGEINLNNQNDLATITNLKLVNQDYGNWIPSSFDYETATVKSIDNIVKEHATFNPILNFKYCHCRLGKPKRVIIYNMVTKERR